MIFIHLLHDRNRAPSKRSRRFFDYHTGFDPHTSEILEDEINYGSLEIDGNSKMECIRE